MKLIAIGDIHGKGCWKTIDPTLYDKVVFLGDYMDSNQHTDRDQCGNLLSIIQFKNKHPEKVELLLGNHDMHYMLYGFVEPCSGFSVPSHRKFRDVFLENKRIFNIAYQHENYLFSHAGISNQWWNWIKRNNEVEAIFDNVNTIAEGLNKLHRNRDHFKVLHSVGESRGGRKIGGILWADISDTIEDSLHGFHQVVGHSKVTKITSRKNGTETSITYIDALDIKTEFLELDI